jgi:cysteinyl-tRNA synthetase
MADYNAAMDDDFNSQRAIGVIFESVAQLNESRMAYNKAQGAEQSAVLQTMSVLSGFIHSALERLGMETLIFAKTKSEDSALTSNLMDLLIATRKKARETKQFQLADFIRDELGHIGIRLQDHPTGTIWLNEH